MLNFQVRPHWIRSQWSSNAAHQPEHPTRPIPDLAPIAASVESKLKLSAFRLEQDDNRHIDIAHNSGVVDSEMENNQVMDDQGATSSSQPLCHPKNLSQKSAAGRELRECPQTPVGRLPLAELIAGGEDFNNQALNLTPVERVLWNHSPLNKGETGSCIGRKSRKRRHSSSPASSSQNEISSQFPAEKTTVDLQNLQMVLKTPQTDPASELWSRYSMNTNSNADKVSPGGLAATTFALHSSPQTPAEKLESKDFGGLRRAISCSMEWPTSAAKRRKIQYSSSHREAKVGFGIPAAAKDEKGKSKMARVSHLVEEIQLRLSRSYAREGEVIAGPSSSSPLPDRRDFAAYSTLPCSPNRKEQIGSEAKHTSATNPNPSQNRSLVGAANSKMEQTSLQETLSEFDDDLDDEIFEAIDDGAYIRPIAAALLTKPPRTDSSDYGLDSSHPEFMTTMPDVPPDRKEEKLFMNSTKLSTEKRTLSAAAPTAADSPFSRPFGDIEELNDDEFDEDDNEFSAADLEDVAAMYDVKPQRQDQQLNKPSQDAKTSHKSQAQSSRAKALSSSSKQGRFVEGMTGYDVTSDDEFGDGLDFEKIVAECEEASQKPHLASQSQSSVRTLVFGPRI